MSNFFEIVFEDVNKRDLQKVFYFLIKCADSISDANIIDCPEKEGMGVADCFSYFFDSNELSAMMAMMHNFSISDSIKIPSALLRIVRHENTVDIDFCFESADYNLVNKIMISAIIFTRKMSEEFRIKNIYAGMEPASDKETRYFTNNIPGPLLRTHVNDKRLY